MSQDLVSPQPPAQPGPLTAMDIRAQVNRIQEVMQSVMHNGTHYGVIPGCGDKPALLKPGAEKLMMTFRMAVDPVVEDRSDESTCRYRVLARLTHAPTGQFLGQGLGECSSDEEKYAWRKVSVEQEWHEADPGDRREKWRRGKGGQAYKEKQIRTNPADVANTVLKMAKKRALIDAVLTVTAASDIFTQDIEEIEIEETPPTPHGETLKDKLKTQVRDGALAAASAAPVSVDETPNPPTSPMPSTDAPPDFMQEASESADWQAALEEKAGDTDALVKVYGEMPELYRKQHYKLYSKLAKAAAGHR